MNKSNQEIFNYRVFPELLINYIIEKFYELSKILSVFETLWKKSVKLIKFFLKGKFYTDLLFDGELVNLVCSPYIFNS